MADFVAYYWSEEDVPSTLREVVRVMSSGGNREALEVAFGRLLESGESAARGVAMDQFVYGEASSRFGRGNPFARWSARILAVARAELERPPVMSRNEHTGGVYAANYASALGVLGHLGTTADLKRIERFFDPALDVNVFAAACTAVSRCVEGAEPDAIAHVVERLLTIVQDTRLPEQVRDMAISPIRMSPALAQVAVAPLLEVAQGNCLLLAIQAAWALVGRAELDEELRRIVAQWPDDAPYPASEVRDLLEEGSR